MTGLRRCSVNSFFFAEQDVVFPATSPICGLSTLFTGWREYTREKCNIAALLYPSSIPRSYSFVFSFLVCRSALPRCLSLICWQIDFQPDLKMEAYLQMGVES